MKRTIEVSTRGTRLTLVRSRVRIELEEEIVADIPIEDLSTIVVDSTGISISSGVLKSVSEAGGVIVCCDDSHQPCGLYWPLTANSLLSERARLQSQMSAPLRKNLWSRIVRSKVRNQALNVSDSGVRAQLLELAERVRSGDEGGIEGRAARIYWSVVFLPLGRRIEQPFHRRREGLAPNNFLNYGYTVLRAATARALCLSGLQPMVGVHHRNRYSGFCLADDVMEPYRPIVDWIVRGLCLEGFLKMTKEVKARLLGVLTEHVMVDGQAFMVGTALERTAASLAVSVETQAKNGDPAPVAADHLLLPELDPAWR